MKSSVLNEHTSQELGDAFQITRQWIHQSIDQMHSKLLENAKDCLIERIVVDVVDDEDGIKLVWCCPFCMTQVVNRGECPTEDCGATVEIELPEEFRSTL
jgi:hypothetical protein